MMLQCEIPMSTPNPDVAFIYIVGAACARKIQVQMLPLSIFSARRARAACKIQVQILPLSVFCARRARAARKI